VPDEEAEAATRAEEGVEALADLAVVGGRRSSGIVEEQSAARIPDSRP